MFERYDDPSALWRYAQALLAFRSHGDTEEACQWLRQARSQDPRFLDYLLGDATVSADRVIRFGHDPDESAHSLARLFLPAWRDTPGAITWARKVLRVPLLRSHVGPYLRDGRGGFGNFG